MSDSSRARQRRRRERTGVSAVGDESSQNAPVVRRELPANRGRHVDNDVIRSSHGNGDARNKITRVGSRQAPSDVVSRSMGDVSSSVNQPSDNIYNDVRLLSRSFTATCRCYHFICHVFTSHIYAFIVVLAASGWIKINAILNNTIKCVRHRQHWEKN